MSRFIPGQGPISAKLMICGEAPGYHEDKEGIPFVGPSGSLLNRILSNIGIERDEVYVTNIVKHRPPNNDFKRAHEVCDLDKQREILRQEIVGIKPNCILALGIEAVKELTNRNAKMKDIRGSILPSKYGPKVVCTYHPAALLRSSNQEFEEGGEISGPLPYWMRYIVEFDFRRAAEQAKFSAYNPPQRQIIIAKNSSDVWRWRNEVQDKEYCAADIEALGCIPSMIALSCNPKRAISIPLFRRMFGIEITSIPHSDLAECWRLVAEELEGIKKKIGQNFKYDQDKLARLGFKVENFHADNLLIASVINPEFYKGHGFLTSIYTEEPFYKDEGKNFRPGKDRIEDWHTYNGKDACTELEVFLEQKKELEELGLTSFYFDYVHHFHSLYLEIENLGFNVDEECKKILNKKYKEKSERLLEGLKEILKEYEFDVDKFNPRSPKQVSFALYDVLKIPRRKGTGEEILFSLLANVVKQESKRIFVRSILDYRKSEKTRSTYIAASPDYDGRMKTQYRIAGTETGRTSTSILEPPIRPERIGIALQTMTKHGEIGSELRSQYIPDNGFVLVEVDLSQAEPRIVALLSEDDELMSKFGKIDIHSWTAELALSIPMEKVLKGSGERHIGKTLRNAGNYDIGKHEFMLHCNTDAAKYDVKDWTDISEWKSEQLLNKFHDFTPKVKGVFHRDVDEALRKTRVLVNPFGRRRQFFGDLENRKTYKEGYAHLPQSTVRDIVGHAMIDGKCLMPDTKILLEMHDALLFEFPIGEERDRTLEWIKLFEREVDFERCTLSRGILYPKADAQIGVNWKDLEDFEL